MRPQRPTHWLLDGRTGWRTQASDGITVRHNLRLSGGVPPGGSATTGRPAHLTAPLAAAPSRVRRTYVRKGWWTSLLLDSRVHRCDWDRVALDVRLPPGTSVTVDTTTFDEPPGPDALIEWSRCGGQAGQAVHIGRTATGGAVDWPVRSRPGRYLAVRLCLRGPGWCTPRVRALRAHYPRASHLDFLPEVYRSAPDSRDFLDRFLMSLLGVWDDLSDTITHLPALYAPESAPSSAMLRLLASWFGVGLDEGDLHPRRWVRANLDVRRRRGTPDALRALISALLHSRFGIRTEGSGFPRVVEGKAGQGAWLALNIPGQSTLGRPLHLWSEAMIGRLRIGAYSQLGKARLLNAGDPTSDMAASVNTVGQRFQVYLLLEWKEKPGLAQAVCRLLEEERPATTEYELRWTSAALRVEVQSTVGVDTVVALPRVEPTRPAASPAQDDDPCATI
ncbi:phage tail protein domain-containing protein [Streptoalloteichus tenebrarius]|uniref:Phage tail protein domain-containing protein n=1 Tax=Streptoalloteichus tenebrarius (strain ATCC 17920 / DSM 40477 / JCM 4838 / CBS 697.72 / NBRC 16177 / NCIMB 11028 / NRRL B-12390 / A12253. 1 / ISP 5477) TaxID=1933 RepID=A0ABT1HNT3_STRSD|nr:phage tail protein [Streptoalloteichus tenebrarius]MCP2257172.1 phage tail protein domain-containing protein [Streptoalloteichus tenebrarius]BFE98806.1 hypothetical protein GCM10020241_04820 [Streptoalloteichus tenebrarius]